MAFSVGAASGGFGGVLTAGLIGNINPTLFQYQVSVNVLILVIFGGMGSIWGVATPRSSRRASQNYSMKWA